jgi:hypothetical protein
MKRFNSSFYGFSFFLFVQPVFASNVHDSLSHTLIVGASISYGYDSVSGGTQPDPVTILATRYHQQSGIIKRTAPGKNSGEILNLIQPSDLPKASITIGLDLFFWDSVLQWGECDAAVARVNTVYTEVHAKRIPWVLGRVPDLGFRQNCMSALNQKIDQLCSQDSKCRLIDFPKIVDQIKRDGGIKLNGTFYTPKEIQPDGVHLSRVASEWVADLLDAAIDGRSSPFIIFGKSHAKSSLDSDH